MMTLYSPRKTRSHPFISIPRSGHQHFSPWLLQRPLNWCLNTSLITHLIWHLHCSQGIRLQTLSLLCTKGLNSCRIKTNSPGSNSPSSSRFCQSLCPSDSHLLSLYHSQTESGRPHRHTTCCQVSEVLGCKVVLQSGKEHSCWISTVFESWLCHFLTLPLGQVLISLCLYFPFQTVVIR